MVISRAGNDNTASSRKLLQPRGNVDSIAVHIVAFGDDVAEIDADTHIDTAGVGQAGIALRHAALQANGALDGVDDTGELSQQTVAHQLENAAAMALDLRFEQVLAM